MSLHEISIGMDLVQLGRNLMITLQIKSKVSSPWHLLLPITTPPAFPHNTSYFPMHKGFHYMTPLPSLLQSTLSCNYVVSATKMITLLPILIRKFEERDRGNSCEISLKKMSHFDIQSKSKPILISVLCKQYFHGIVSLGCLVMWFNFIQYLNILISIPWFK